MSQMKSGIESKAKPQKLGLQVDLEAVEATIMIDGYAMRTGSLFKARHMNKVDEFIPELFTFVGQGMKYYPTTGIWRNTGHHLGDLLTRFINEYFQDFYSHLDKWKDQIEKRQIEKDQIEIEISGGIEVIAVPFELMLDRIPFDKETQKSQPTVKRVPLSVNYVFKRRVLIREGRKKSPQVSDLCDKDPKDWRVLIIKSDVTGSVNTKNLDVPVSITVDKLLGIERETQMLRTLFPQATIIPEGGASPWSEKYATWESISTQIQKQEWDIVHFAGHGFYDEGTMKGGLVLSESPKANLPIAIPAHMIDYLIGKYPHIALMYLSSCEGAMAQETTKSTAHYSCFDGVIESFLIGSGCVIAYRWPVSDAVASQMAGEFYKGLKSKPSVELALQGARDTIFHAKEQDNAWASAVLAFPPI